MLGADGYKTKQELRKAIGQPLKYIETSMFGSEFKPNGKNVMVGPCAYTARKWYAEVVCENGLIKKVS